MCEIVLINGYKKKEEIIMKIQISTYVFNVLAVVSNNFHLHFWALNDPIVKVKVAAADFLSKEKTNCFLPTASSCKWPFTMSE